MANNLATEKKVLAVSMLAEGTSSRSSERITGVHRDTIMRLGVRVGEACVKIHDDKMRGINSRRVEIDEIWGFIGKKKKNTKPGITQGLGDVWTFIAFGFQHKLIPSFRVGQRTLIHAQAFLEYLEGRLTSRIQLSSDALAAYRETVGGVFGPDVDYGQVVKTYSVTNLNKDAASRYSPAEVVKVEKTIVTGMPDITRMAGWFLPCYWFGSVSCYARDVRHPGNDCLFDFNDFCRAVPTGRVLVEVSN